jgi:DnaJ-class molecular chaperone
LQRTQIDHYATLGLDRSCSQDQIRSAYRILAKRVHPDVNSATADAVEQTQRLNLAYEHLGDPERRRDYDAELARPKSPSRSPRSRAMSVSQDMHLRIEEFFRGTTLGVHVNDPGSADGPEVHTLIVPVETAPGTRFKVMRNDGSNVVVRVRARPGPRFKIRGSDLRCDLRISAQRAIQGGVEFIAGPMGTRHRLNIPRGVARGEIVRIAGEGLPRTRGGRGDLLVRLIYRPEVRITRAGRR